MKKENRKKYIIIFRDRNYMRRKIDCLNMFIWCWEIREREEDESTLCVIDFQIALQQPSFNEGNIFLAPFLSLCKAPEASSHSPRNTLRKRLKVNSVEHFCTKFCFIESSKLNICKCFPLVLCVEAKTERKLSIAVQCFLLNRIRSTYYSFLFI